jgi:hypothetical protein
MGHGIRQALAFAGWAVRGGRTVLGHSTRHHHLAAP